MRSEWTQVRDDIKSSLTMDEVLRLCNLPQPTNGKIRSLTNPNDRTPSLHIYKDHWYDFSTGEGGDQISFVQMALGLRYMDALQFLGRGIPAAQSMRQRFANGMSYEVSDYTARFESEPETDPGSDDEKAWEKLVARKWPYLELVDLYLFGCKVVDSGDLWIPHWILEPHDNVRYVRGIKVRHLPDAHKSAVRGSNFTVGLYRPVVGPDRTHAVVVEGESDAWVMAKMLQDRDVTVLALPAGAATRKERFLDELKSFQTVGFAFDSDEPGKAALDWFMTKLMVDMGPIHQLYPIEVPGGRVAEAAAAGWRL